MLIRFEVSNFRSILQPAELSLVAVDRGRDAVRPVPNLGESLLPVAAIFGPNASGKSNILAALSWLRSAVRDSLRMWDTVLYMPLRNTAAKRALRLSSHHEKNDTTFPCNNPSSSMYDLLAASSPNTVCRGEEALFVSEWSDGRSG